VSVALSSAISVELAGGLAVVLISTKSGLWKVLTDPDMLVIVSSNHLRNEDPQ
jgi:hypothetical protein